MFWDYSLGDLLAKGGFIMWPLLCCSVGALALLIDRGIAHYRVRLKFRPFVGRLEKLINRGKLSEALNLQAANTLMQQSTGLNLFLK